jgi:uncharacterized repeat protein (TIGR01451 family)
MRSPCSFSSFSRTDGVILSANAKNKKVPAVFFAGLFLFFALAASASAASPSPGWEVTSAAFPTRLPPGGIGHLEINLYNVGAAHSTGAVTVTDTLPAGVTMTSAGFDFKNIEGEEFPLWDCTGTGTSVVTCTSDPTYLPSIPFHLEEEGGGPFEDNGPRAQIGLAVNIGPGVEGTLPNQVTVSGGGALAPASVTEPIVFSSTSASSFGINGVDGWFSNADGTADTQAGSHPYDATFSFGLNTFENPSKKIKPVGGHIRRVDVNLPRGLVGNPTAVPQCPRQLLVGSSLPACPVSTEVGFLTADLPLGFEVGGNRLLPAIHLPVYNMVPPPGVPAELGTEIIGIPVVIDAGVRTGSDYGISAHVNNLPQNRPIVTSSVTLWGEPADPRHDFERFSTQDGGCNAGCAVYLERKPFLTVPTSCGAPQVTTMDAAPWESLAEPTAEFLAHDSAHTPAGFSGCDHLGFKPSITVAPDTTSADTPAGLTVEVKVPQEGLVDPNGLATSNIKDTTVTLPKGVVINPGQAAGLGACQTAESAVGTEGEAKCPPASKVGTVQITTPLLSEKLEGDVYVLQSNPPNLKLLVAASGEGVNLKLVGNVHLDEATGQLTTTFSETPQLPFTLLKLSFSGGAQAALDTPTQCGEYTTTSDFTPWSTKAVADVFPSSGFAIEHGAGGGACPPSPLPFAPAMTAGSTNPKGGGYTNFSLSLHNGDAQQRIGQLQFIAPPGLSAMLSNVPLCPEPQAGEGACSEASQIGHATVASGAGPYPLVIPQPGEPPARVFLTGPYHGAPFGLSIATPVLVGPFNLGVNVVRAKIEVDPHTAQITVTTDPAGSPHGIPSILDGVPTDLRTIDTVVDRPGFMFNPTHCVPGWFSGTAWGTPPPGAGGPGATGAISTPFDVVGCKGMAFTPKIAVTTAAKSSKVNGASLLFKIAYPSGAQGRQAWFSEAKFDLPKQLPARLTTLQKACLASVFESNPAGCPPASLIGHAVVHTPVLPVPLAGPVYFVSHGGEKFPDAVIVLQGDGVTVDLVGETFINGKTGITSATFRNTPDVPFENIEVTIPAGPFSEFGANLPASAHGSFCGQKLVMPTLFKAQNGLEIHANTPVGVTGCAKAKTRAQLYAAALKACHRDKNKAKRKKCEATARKKYGSAARKKR